MKKNNILYVLLIVLIIALASAVMLWFKVNNQLSTTIERLEQYQYTGDDLREAHKNGYVVGFQVGRRTDLTHSEGYKDRPVAPGDFVNFVMND